jgi:hypothetical protein
MPTAHHLSALTRLPQVESDDERRALWRQSMATLARAALEQQPVPLEGIDSTLLLEAVRTAIAQDLVLDLDWLSPPAAAAAVYELAAALPIGNERRQLGRLVLMRLYEGDAETFVALATSLAAESRRMLTGAPMRARIALVLEQPIGSGLSPDRLALALISRPDLRREWLSEPAAGALPSRRLAARLLERAARESARRAAQGDAGSLRAFQEPAVQTAWRLLLGDRESLVWRHVAVARGILSGTDAELREEIASNLAPNLSATEWRRAAVSLAASIALDAASGLERCRALLEDDALRADPGLPATMIYGLARAAEAEPEAAEELLNQIVRIGGLEGAEALVELRRERVGELGSWAAGYARDKLEQWLAGHRIDDDGRVALCEALVEELSTAESRRPQLREELDAAIRAFGEQNARAAYAQARAVLERVLERVTELEHTTEQERVGRRVGFRAMRDIDSTLLETTALGDLLTIGHSGRDAQAAAAPLGDVFERLTGWLVRGEGRAITESGGVDHLTLRLRRMRTLLHVVDADGCYGDDTSGRRRERRVRVARVLLARSRNDASSPLRRIVCAALARSLDALVRDEICELSDVVIAVGDNVPSAHDQLSVAEASMIPDMQRAITAYAQLTRTSEGGIASGRRARAALDALVHVAQSLPWASTLRVSALRQGLLRLARELESIAGTRSLGELAATEPRPLSQLEGTVFALAQLTIGARRRLVQREQRSIPESGNAISALEVTVEQLALGHQTDLGAALDEAHVIVEQELPPGVAGVARIVLERLRNMSLQGALGRQDSFVPPAPKEAPLPPWLPSRRILGGFYVQRALGVGGVGSVFVVTRAEERTREHAPRFALKVPDYSAEAARTLSEEQFLTLFREEAGALLALPRHRNLATFVTFDAGAKPKPILVMELVEGPTLERVIERGELNVERAVMLLDSLADGLAAMHAAGIGHLDVKPNNVILRTQPGSAEIGTPVLVDFGLAGRHIRPGCATGPYGAPEIWGLCPDGWSPDPMAADVYAFSCLAYEVLTGDTLFDGQSELAVINSHLTHDGYPEKLLSLRQHPGLTAVCDLIANGLRQHPGERITMHDMRAGLRELLPGLRQLPWPLLTVAAA